jgi:hypothetical protein
MAVLEPKLQEIVLPQLKESSVKSDQSRIDAMQVALDAKKAALRRKARLSRKSHNKKNNKGKSRGGSKSRRSGSRRR